MKQAITLLAFIIVLNTHAQIPEGLQGDFLLEDELLSENMTDKYVKNDFSSIWMTKNNDIVYGIIGEDHQRIHVKFLSIKQHPFNNTEYVVYGKTMVKDNVCQFSGIIKIIEIKEVKELHYGVDDEYEDIGIQSQGILIAEYIFNEFENQKHSGSFEGRMMSKWYLTNFNKMRYDEFQSIADGYTNNMFVGKWTSDKTGHSKVCNWADYRVPLAKRDFDIGAAEFYVAKKYWDKGWSDIALKYNSPVTDKEQANRAKSNREWWE